MSDVKRTIHIEIPAEATDKEVKHFDVVVSDFILDARWGNWDPILYVHPGACEESDHCAGPGSNVEAAILARAALSQDEPEYEYTFRMVGYSPAGGAQFTSIEDARTFRKKAMAEDDWVIVRRPKQQPWEDVEG